jgi:hypothetical protein
MARRALRRISRIGARHLYGALWVDTGEGRSRHIQIAFATDVLSKRGP